MNTDQFQQKYRIDSARLAGYDYGASGMYFVTICTRNRDHFFGEIVETKDFPSLQLTPIGQVAIDCWQAVSEHFPFVLLDAFQLMPNHLHGVLWIDKPTYTDWKPNTFGPQSRNLASVVRGFKIGVTKHANQHQLDFGWQPGYYDRVVRNDDELNRIRTYIENNPARWHQDRDNTENLYM